MIRRKQHYNLVDSLRNSATSLHSLGGAAAWPDILSAAGNCIAAAMWNLLPSQRTRIAWILVPLDRRMGARACLVIGLGLLASAKTVSPFWVRTFSRIDGEYALSKSWGLLRNLGKHLLRLAGREGVGPR